MESRCGVIIMYKKIWDSLKNQEASNILRLSDMASIPKVRGNSDYEEYLEWLSEENTPEEAE
jgi:hypothetical protein